jgi:hypothetical protein
VGEDETQEISDRGRLRKRILLFSILLVILAASSLYYVFQNVYYHLRRDVVPAGAYVVPWMQPGMSVDELQDPTSRWRDTPWDLDMIMPASLKLNMTFEITVPNGKRVIPSTVYLGHDTDYLYVGGKFSGMYRNPAATKGEGIPQYFAMYFNAKNDGVLSFPESGSRFSAGFAEGNFHPSGVWGCDDMIWAYDAWYTHRETWLSAEDYYNNQRASLPQQATTPITWEYDNSTGTWTILFTRYLLGSGDPRTNAFIMRSGERWVVGFNLELGYFPGGVSTEILTDGWPEKTYPYLSNDTSQWPKLAIDLTGPPSWLIPQT